MFELEMQTTNNCLSLHTGLAWSLIQTYQFINFMTSMVLTGECQHNLAECFSKNSSRSAL